MATSSVLLLSREFHSLKKRPCSNWFQVYDLNDDKIHEWIIFVIGPPATLYEGGIFRGILRFPEDYPMSPPSLQFTSEVFHPNIYRDGKVCLSTLQVASPDEPNADVFWRPVLSVEQALLSVVSLLSDPNLDDPANLDAASMLRNDPSAFKNKVHKSCLSSVSLVPDDFVMPVVVGTSAAAAAYHARRGGGGGGGARMAVNSSGGARYRDDDDEEEDGEEEYVYSDDEGDQDDDQENDAYSVDESETSTMASSSSSSLAGALALDTSLASTKAKADKKKAKAKEKKKTEKAEKSKSDKKKNKSSSRSSSRHGNSSRNRSKDGLDDAVVQGTTRRSSRIKSGSRRGSK